MVNFYKDMWAKRSKTLGPLTSMTGKPKRHPYIWTEECQKAFDNMKAIMIQDALIVYPKYRDPFDIHTDASDYQIGGVVSQNNKPIAYFSRKFNTAQINYTVTAKLILAIVKTLKKFHSMLLGKVIKI